MVLGLRAKTRRGPTVLVDYYVHIQEIKPWPPSHSLRSIRSVLIQWENSDTSSGSTNTVVPSLDQGTIVFNESFRLSVTLYRDVSLKAKTASADADIFHKNLLELNLYEPRRDKAVKGQLLGTAIIDLAEYAAINEMTSVSVAMNCTRSFRNTAQPILYIKIQCVERSRSSSSLSSRAGLAKAPSLEKNSVDSVSALMNEEYLEEAEVASFTDDDVSSHSSVTDSTATLSLQSEEAKENRAVPPKLHLAELNTIAAVRSHENHKGSLSHLLPHLSSEPGGPTLAISLSNMSEKGILSNSGECSQKLQENHQEGIKEGLSSNFSAQVMPTDERNFIDDKLNLANDTKCQDGGADIGNNFADSGSLYDIHNTKAKDLENQGSAEILEEPEDSSDVESLNAMTIDSVKNQVSSANGMSFSRDKVKHVKSVRSPVDSTANGLSGVSSASSTRKETKAYSAEKRNASTDSKVHELENRIKMLEQELREAAAIEVSLYSVVAEHGSSISKVHAPARRLSRLYLQAGKRNAQLRRASAAKTAVSGLVVVAKACGNDVPRLTFWLSNCVVFRTIVTQALVEQKLPFSAGPLINKAKEGKRTNTKSPRLMWKASSSGEKEMFDIVSDSYDDWGDPCTLTSSLERVESWIFSRIVESIWWQTLTVHMQPSAARVIEKDAETSSRRNSKRLPSSGDQLQVNFSLDLWKKAFKDACERLCPVRAGGHACGCLPVLAKLIMEQCVARLDVAMFNAILRESADDIPTDPVSDPISDAKVLPIPAGKSSFGAGAQLKNVIGNWSRWLTDLFGIDDDDSVDEETDNIGDNEKHYDSSFKSFHLLKSLSDLMMLPKDMLLNSSIRKEVCPAFGAQLIKRVLDNFVPDEFCPDHIPAKVFEALDSEDILEEGNGVINSFPCMAPAPFYLPPSAASLTSFIGDIGSQAQLRRSGSSLLRKSITSDDELDELDSPLSSILVDSPRGSHTQTLLNSQVKEKGGENAVRYQLLREVWRKSE